MMGGFLYWALLRCSSTSLGVTQMTCCPFQYLTMLRDWRVLMMSVWVMLVIWLGRGRRGGYWEHWEHWGGRCWSHVGPPAGPTTHAGWLLEMLEELLGGYWRFWRGNWSHWEVTSVPGRLLVLLGGYWSYWEALVPS